MQVIAWLMLFGGIVLGPAALVLGYQWYRKLKRRGRRRHRSRS